jgi:uncharacterized protein (TIGR02270 family)
MDAPSQRQVIPLLVEQHASEAAFLWSQRSAAARAPHYGPKDLARLDGRVEAHLDGLRIAGPAGWEIAKAALSPDEPGTVFAAGVLGFESGAADRIAAVFEAVRAAPKATALAAASALGWMPWAEAGKRIPSLLADPDPPARLVGVSACAQHRQDPGAPLVEAASAADGALRARALEALAELGQSKHLPLLQKALDAEDPEVRFAAAWGATILSTDAEAHTRLKKLAVLPGTRAEAAAELASRRLKPEAAAAWRDQLAGNPATARTAVRVAGASGDPGAIPWLLDRMTSAPLARVAGEAFEMITGADLAYLDLDGPPPKEAPPAEVTGPADPIPTDEDADLPWPDAKKCKAWWDGKAAGLAAGKRHLLGREISEAACKEVLAKGRQRQRAAAAVELALLRPGTPLVDVAAPTFRKA